MLKKLTESRGDVGAMKQFVVLGIFILIGVIVYANIFASAGQIRVTGESANATFVNSNDTYTVLYATGGIYSTPEAVVYADGAVADGGTAGTNWTMAYATGILTMLVTPTMNNTAITIDYTRSGAGNVAAGKTSIDNLNTTWYNSVDLLIIVFLVIAAVVILAYVGRIGGGQ
jgi:hypothetical protein